MSFPPLDANRKVEKFGRRPYSQGFPTFQIKKSRLAKKKKPGARRRIFWKSFETWLAPLSLFLRESRRPSFSHTHAPPHTTPLSSSPTERGRSPNFLPVRRRKAAVTILFPASVLILLLLLRPPTLLSRMRPKGGGGRRRRRRRERPFLPLFSSLLSLSLPPSPFPFSGQYSFRL